MPIELKERWQRVMSRRLGRLSFLAQLALYACALGILIVPFATFQWTSPIVVREAYTWIALGLGAVALGGIIYAFMRRLRDQGLSPFLAPIVLIVLPVGLTWIAWWYGQKQVLAALNNNEIPAAQSSDYGWIANGLALLVVLVVALRKSVDGESKVERPDFAIKLGGACLLLVAGYAIYGGLFQDGLWVRRDQYSTFAGTGLSTPDGGRVIASCGNAKGVSAVNQANYDGDGGFVRDAVGGTWNLVLLRDGYWDIQTNSPTQQHSYNHEGFVVSVRGVTQTKYGLLPAATDRFVVLAHSLGEAGLPDTVNVTTIVFTKRVYDWRATISSSNSMSRNSLSGGGKDPRSSNFLMIADCYVPQEYKR